MAGTRGPVTPRIVIVRFRAKRSAVPFIPAEVADLLNVSEGLVTPRWDGVMPRYPNVFVSVSDGKPISEIIERAETAMKRAGISSEERREFRACVPGQYALAIDYIREWCETD